ncbi:hypothetical protein ACFLY2_00715 [Patescibacteria group bacterium]
MSEKEIKTKNTSLFFGWMKEGQYPKFLYRDIEVEKMSMRPILYIKKEKYPILWNHMSIFKEYNLQIEGVTFVILRLRFDSVEDNFGIEYYTDKTVDSMKTAGFIKIFNLTLDEVIEAVKSKISEVKQK